jgi:membrane protease YdiL (CAAX protease family)
MAGPVGAGRRRASRQRIEPSVGVAVAVVLAYMVVVNSIQVSSGIDYQDWFDTAGNAVRTAVVPLAVGNVLLLAFVWWARWDIFWRDPERLPMSRLGSVIIGLFVATVVVRLAAITWTDVPGDLLLAVLATGVLVGLAEELVFRGVVLRCLRTGDRPESSAALWTAVGFGLFHLPNIFMGTGLAGLSQIVLAALTGYALYLFRRWHGVIWMAMVAHGIWDISAFLVGDYGRDVPAAAALALSFVVALACLVALVRSLRTDRGFTVTPRGVVPMAA